MASHEKPVVTTMRDAPVDAGAVAAAMAALADQWRPQRAERLGRTSLAADDLAAVRATGYPLLIVPREHGGLWDGMATVGRIADALGSLARVDPSLALVVSMHPAVLAYWLGAPDAPAPHTAAWADQRERFFRSAVEGHLWGTVTSEPGSGGDVFRTRTVAEPVGGDDPTLHRLTGQKHFGSGFGQVSFMMTTARVPGEDSPDVYVLDLRGWEASSWPSVTVTQPWDGSGMRATQSHAVALDAATATRAAWPFGPLTAVPFASAVMLPLWVAIVAAVIDEAVAEARDRLAGRRADLRPYEATEWVHVDLERFQVHQVLDGCRRALADDGIAVDELALTALRSKLAVAELAESIMARLGRAVGGGTFSRASPLSAWYEDVRALGFLRPPWALGYDLLLEATLPSDP